jgi:ABC-type nitrate/sulfonate/bicarbonate transport system substrate-binding protein
MIRTAHAQPVWIALGVWLAGLAVVACGAPASTASPPAAPAAPAARPAEAPDLPAAQPPAPARTVKIGVPNKGVAFTFLYAGKRLGTFAQHGLDVEITSIPPQGAIPALLNSELDFHAAAGSAIRAALRGVPIRVALVASNGPDHILLGARDLTSVEQLRGKEVAGYGPQATVDTIIIELLRRRGLDTGQYTLISAGDGPGRAAALTNGLAVATLLDPSNAVVLQKEGYPVLARASGEVEMPFVGLATTQDALQNRRDHVRQVLMAALDSLQAVRTRKDATIQAMAQEFDLPADDAALIYDSIQAAWTSDGRPSRAGVEFEFAIDQREMELPALPKFEDVFDLSVLEEIAARR